jgi:hypothetical protein
MYEPSLAYTALGVSAQVRSAIELHCIGYSEYIAANAHALARRLGNKCNVLRSVVDHETNNAIF